MSCELRGEEDYLIEEDRMLNVNSGFDPDLLFIAVVLMKDRD
jgi:hypothetical protein